MKMFDLIVNNSKENSLASKMRRKRFEFFQSLIEKADMPKPIRILDVGGTQRFWEVMNSVNSPDIQVTLLNITPNQVNYHNFTSIVGDATNLSQFENNQFDIAFSNSVIEHVGNEQMQMKMAREMMRVATRYFVQTPNYYFPIEPHFLFVGFHWLPVPWRISLIHHFNLGWERRRTSIAEAKSLVENTRLLKRKELVNLFPNACFYEEKFMGLTKSLIVYGGW